MLHVEVWNFQSVMHAALDIDGYVALVGKSNIGKSAIVRAVQCALTGAVGTDFVRHGPACDRRTRQTKKCKCFCRVSITTSALKVDWYKGDDENRYVVTRDGVEQEYKGLDRGTPEFLSTAFSMVAVGDEKELIQVPNQFDPIFLLNQTGSTVANVMSDVARLDEVNNALTSVNKDRKDSVSKRKVREEDVGRLKVDLEAYKGLDEVGVDDVSALHADLEKTQAALARQERFLEQARALKEVLIAIKTVLNVKLPSIDTLDTTSAKLQDISRYEAELQALRPAIESLQKAVAANLPAVEVLVSGTGSLEEATQFDQALDALHPEIEALEEALSVPLPDILDLEKRLSLATKAEELFATLALLVPTLKRLKGVDEIKLDDDAQLRSSYAKLVQTDGYLNRLDVMQANLSRWDSFSSLPPLEVDGLREAYGTLAQVDSYMAKASALNKTIQTLMADLKTSESEKQEAQDELQALGVCPTCSQDIDANHCLHLEAS
jgi:DNA repair ATPase RecN